ncbi:2-hydroxy-6-oxononadienedioate/2-hydroxy-6-oxononatrienedioate hydrolase-like isoform X2 [Hordeum vulgare subsp. vulgare]|uniref:2-hydroxy-6-oxononadienedioate/2-hydroxy-6- oxononatrienedioate hydrolase-like isoform X2 n=1 Tax=Hordeum vulgare subsp. vulgare TaxID=112509 RepID=UPI001D1A370F|nr:2-hydroxy-6-oxononadienedioate/2-hydroxy-6-oxononatrienedioate hydrolase-like isoform X2 [Hordeum vulgare subsp. vulgare]
MPPILTFSSPAPSRARFRVAASAVVGAPGHSPNDFPSFLPRAVESIRDGAAIRLAKRIERVPVQTGFSTIPILSSCVRPFNRQQSSDPVVLLHGFDSSCLEWRYTYPLLEDAGLEAWAVDVLGWGFSNLETRPPCDTMSKREHLYQFWRSYIKRPMTLVGSSLGAAVAIDFAVNHPEAVSKLIFIGASVYAEGTRDMTGVPKFVPYAGAFVLKSLPLRVLATHLTFYKTPDEFFESVQIGRLHCLLPWWEDATVHFMITGGYNVVNQINQQKCLVLWGEDDGIISNKEAFRLQQELPSAILRQVNQCGHIPHLEKPREAVRHMLEFLQSDNPKKAERASSLSSNFR